MYSFTNFCKGDHISHKALAHSCDTLGEAAHSVFTAQQETCSTGLEQVEHQLRYQRSTLPDSFEEEVSILVWHKC
eukprot:2453167-Amphidinium_carterae.2